MVPERLSQYTAVKEYTLEQGTSESEVPAGDMHPGHHTPPPPLSFQDSLCRAGWSPSHSTRTSLIWCRVGTQPGYQCKKFAKTWSLEARTALFLTPLTPSAEVELKSRLVIFSSPFYHLLFCPLQQLTTVQGHESFHVTVV